jgi:alpha-amylase
MATKFFSDGAVHAYFNPYETPYDAFMNYMNVLSDFEIRLRKWFPDTAEQEQILKLGSQIIEKDMIIEKQANEIEKLTKKIAKIKPAGRSTIKKESKSAAKIPAGKEPIDEAMIPVKKQTKVSTKEPVKKRAGRPPKAKTITAKKTTPLKPFKTAKRSKKIE